MNNSKSFLKAGLAATAMLAVTPTATDGSGFDVPDEDAFAVARGLAVVATADDPSAIFYNPAGLTQLRGNNLRAGFYATELDTQFTPNGGHNTYHNETPWAGLPQLFYAHSSDSGKFSFGLGVYVPSGLGNKWQDTTGFRTLGTLGSVEQFVINPVAAFKILPSLSVGAGLSANYANVDLRQGILWPGQPFDQFRFQGDGWGMAGNVGLRWQPLEKVAFGATLRTGLKTELDGYTEAYNSVGTPLPNGSYYPAFSVRTDAKVDFQFPLNAVAGVSYRPTTNWNLEVDGEYIDWDSVGTLSVQQAHAVPPLFPKNIPLVLNWQSSCYALVGATRYFEHGWHASAGYIFNQNSVPDAHYSTVAADEDRHYFSVGFGRKGKSYDFDIAYQFGWGPDRSVTGSAPSATGQTANGTWGLISHAVAVSLGWHF